MSTTSTNAKWTCIRKKSLESIPEKEAASAEIEVQCDELWSFVGSKEQKSWVWLALDCQTRAIVGMYVGRRDEQGALGLWTSMPVEVQNYGLFYTDFWEPYAKVFPQDRHVPVTKNSGKTS